MNETTIPHRRGFSETANRESKANKIIKILEEFVGHSVKKARLLDIGTGNGEISYFLTKQFEVISVDIQDHRQSKEGYAFVITNELLPFPDEYFDIVVSNHVIEHVSAQSLHLSEIVRVLKPNGVVYLATPNRLWPWEVHYQVPFLHYLPNSLFISVLKGMGKYQEEVNLLTWYGMKKLFKPYFKIHIYGDRVCKWPGQYFMNCSQFSRQILNVIPLKIYTLLTFIHPTFVVILEKKD